MLISAWRCLNKCCLLKKRILYWKHWIKLFYWHFRAYSRKIMLFRCLIHGFLSLSVYKANADCKSCHSFNNVSNVSSKSCTFLWYGKKENYLHEKSVFTFTNLFFSGAYLIWAPKLNVPKIGFPLSKST